MRTAAEFLICVKHPDGLWGISGWEDDLIEAKTLADQHVVKPFMAETAAVFSVTGSDALPTFTLVHQAKRER